MTATTPDPEDILIRRLIIGGVALVLALFLLIATAIAVLVSFNFNILEWME